MEKRWRNVVFFFEHAVQRFDIAWEFIKRTATKLFQHDGDGQPDSPQTPPGAIIQKRLEVWFDQMRWLADNDVVKLKVVSEMPMLDFFIMLNKKIIETEKQIKRAKKL